MSVWSETDIEAIKREEAAETVKSLRADLRESDALKRRGDHRGYRKARERFGRKMASVGKMLERRFADRAERHFGSDNPHLVREAVEAMYERLYRDLMDLRPEKRYYEESVRDFNRSVKWVIGDVIRRVRVRHGMLAEVKGTEKEKRAVRERERADIPDSLQRREDRAQEGEPTSLPEDAETRAAIEKFAGPNLIRDVLARMPDRKHSKILILHAIKQLTFEQTAEEVGVSEKTARRCYRRAVEIARRTVRRRA